MTTPIDVEKLLHWAFRDELPKKGVVADSATWDHLIELGTMVDGSPGDRLPPACGAPHPDALVIEEAVRSLPGRERGMIDWSVNREALLGDLLQFDEARTFASNELFDPRALVIVHARMGTRPDWNAERPRAVRITGPNGKTVVVGLDKAKRYRLGAYCPLRLDPPLRCIASARAQYLTWRVGLDLVRESLSAARMQDHAAAPPAAPFDPWFVGVEKTPRVLQSLLPVKALSPVVKRRPSTGARLVNANA